MAKLRVVFPYTEAGLGHIMPMNSIADCFEREYGDEVEVVRSRFFTETGDEKLKKYEQLLSHEVVRYNRCPVYGFFATCNMDFWGTRLATWGAVEYVGKGATERGIAHMEELKPDLVFSTHWATNYYAMKMKNRPITVMYCPDAKINPLFRYPCDLVMISTDLGYERALKRHRTRFNESNLKKVPFLIREEAFSISRDKAALRRKLGVAEDKFTVLVADGGYGVGKMEATVTELLRRDLDINLLAVCGKNGDLYLRLSKLKSNGNTKFMCYPLADNMLEIIAAADISCGKSGASLMAEPCFFGIPQLITHYAGDIERWIGKYYIKSVGSAIKEFNVSKACDIIEGFVNDSATLNPYREAAEAQRSNYGAETAAEYIYKLLMEKRK